MKFPNKLFKYILLPFLVLSLSNCNSNSSNNNNNNTNNNNGGTIPQNPNNGENKDVPTGNKVSSALSNFDALPDNFNKTLLSNDEIKNIKNLEDAKSKISTLKDCLRYFSTLTYKNFSYWGFKTSTITDNVFLNTEYRISFNEMNKGVSYYQEFSFNVAQVLLHIF